MERGIRKKDVAENLGARRSVDHCAGFDDLPELGLPLKDNQRADPALGEKDGRFPNRADRGPPARIFIAVVIAAAKQLEIGKAGASHLFQ